MTECNPYYILRDPSDDSDESNRSSPYKGRKKDSKMKGKDSNRQGIRKGDRKNDNEGSSSSPADAVLDSSRKDKVLSPNQEGKKPWNWSPAAGESSTSLPPRDTSYDETISLDTLHIGAWSRSIDPSVYQQGLGSDLTVGTQLTDVSKPSEHIDAAARALEGASTDIAATNRPLNGPPAAGGPPPEELAQRLQGVEADRAAGADGLTSPGVENGGASGPK